GSELVPMTTSNETEPKNVVQMEAAPKKLKKVVKLPIPELILSWKESNLGNKCKMNSLDSICKIW
ncbi:hypothetical protein AVEN_221585-1, partial [Araneus ventricosus]